LGLLRTAEANTGSNDTTPRVSIVIPYFNAAGSMFDDALKSLARQSLQDYEIIVVDDASTDARSQARLATLEAQEARVRIIRHQVNSGLSASRNTGFRHARSQYVFILDTDDMLEPTCLEKSYLFLATQPAAGFVKGYTVGEILDIL
jgi:glycosyltransferase involved in cell wall biosynthesis